ncbi:peptidase, S41 family [Flavobacterium limnosediminis JC2902]|uniref:Peptidase, S41 family n=1 Tax=Flavobacterium limnosediminis JC2902 TaxID=1341181 RepID=V6SUY1_9FLAO|nr:S41 family peptidase [Flavobacterium limnosediminis]ESU28220.1 peptidase, S41 family [Flavobacterium limnosediminis JC2902]
MKKTFLASLLLIIVAGCNSVKYHNKHLNDLLSEKKLKSDVDYAYRKLQKLHPKLYWYISKESLDYKFDSLKSTITKPMTSAEFYTTVSPVIAAIKQGHTSISPSGRRFTKKERKAFDKKGVGPLSQFEFEVFNDKMYVIKNKSHDKTIKPGTEVVAINNENTTDLLKKYATRFASDGYNQTFKKHALSKSFSAYFTYENGIKDSIRYLFKHNDTLKTISIRRSVIDSIKTDNTLKKRLTAEDKAKIKAENKKKSIYGYNVITKTYNRSLQFMEKDSSIAVLKIKGFSAGNYRAFYDESFTKIDRCKSKTLIIDLRNNPGGRLVEIAYLYTYLADDTFIFMDDSQVVSKTSLLKADYFKGSSLSSKVAKIFLAPMYYPYTFFKVHKKEDGNYYYSTQAKPRSINPIAFNGKIYVLINGGSFSASSIISSNLRGSMRAFFVGEETGGTYNGTIAGRMPVTKLPNSGLNLRFGLMANIPHHKTTVEGRGIFPNKVIIPTLEDRIKGSDPEMDWILEDIKANL